jgi:hypothetical protein
LNRQQVRRKKSWSISASTTLQMTETCEESSEANAMVSWKESTPAQVSKQEKRWKINKERTKEKEEEEKYHCSS